MGDAYLKGELSLEKSAEKAFHYYDKAAAQGYSCALAKLGRYNKKGIGSVSCLTSAFEKRISEEYNEASDCYEEMGACEHAEAYLKMNEAAINNETDKAFAKLKAHHNFKHTRKKHDQVRGKIEPSE